MSPVGVVLALVVSLAGVVLPPASASPVAASASQPDGGNLPPGGGARDERAAAALARERGERVEVESERTEYSQTFARPDGSFVIEESLRPQWARRPDGSWAPVDATLQRSGGGLEPVAATVQMTFSPGGSAAPLARMAADGASLGLRWPSALPEPAVEGNTATYRDVAPGIDLQVVADVDGFSHLLVIRSPKALESPLAREFALETELTGVVLRTRGDTGAVEAVDSKGSVVFSGPSPMMWDSRGAAAVERPDAKPDAEARRVAEKAAAEGAPGAARERVDVQPRMAPVSARVSSGRLVLVPDQELLDDPDLTFPVFIDPTWSKTTGVRNKWSLLRKSFPNSSFYNPKVGSTSSTDATHGIVRAGYVVDDRTYTDRSVFNMSTSAVRYKRVNKAYFTLTQSWSWYGCGYSSPPTTELRSVSSFSSSTTWNTSWNATKSGWGTLLATSAKIRRYGYSCGPQKVEFNITKRVQQAAAAGSSSINIGLIARSESTGNWTRFRDDTKLVMEYNTAPNAPTSLKVAGKACATGSSRPYVTIDRPTFTASASDKDSAQQSLTTKFYWWKSSQSRSDSDYVSGSSANPGTATSAAIPSAKALADLTVYKYQAVTSDGIDVTWSGVCEFRTSLNPPNPPGDVTSTAYPEYDPGDPGPGSGGVGLAGSFTISPPAGGHTDVVGYAYTLDSGVGPASAPVKAKDGSGGAAVTVTPLRDGLNTLRVWTKDVAGRFSTLFGYQFVVHAGDGPAAAWRFDNPSAPGEDDTGHANTLALSGGASTVAGRAGVGTALSVDGGSGAAATSGPVTRPHPDTGVPITVATNSTLTVAAWVRLDATGGSGIKAAVAADGSQTSPFVLGYNASTNRWVFQMASADVASPAWTAVSSNSAPTAGRWTHIAGTYDAASKALRLYVMGVLQTSTATLSGSGFNAGGAVTVGRARSGGAGGNYLAGQVDDARIYPYLAPAAELAEAALPLPPLITFPAGDTVTAGEDLQVRFDAAGDTNVVSFTYSVGSAVLDLSVTAGVPGGTATVSIPTSVVEELEVYAANVDGVPRESDHALATASVVAAPAVSGVVYDANTFEPIIGATVMLDQAGLEVISGAGGTYSFDAFAADTYTLAANLGGQCGMAFATELTISEAMVVDLWLTPAIDRFGYTCAEAPGTPYAPVAGAALALSGDDAVAAVSLPFAFPFYDSTYSTAWVDTNGVITFDDPSGSHTGGDRTIPAPDAPNALLAAYWGDLVVDGSAQVRSETTGVAPDREFTVEWHNVYLKGDPSARVSIRASLHEQGHLLLNYSGLDTATERGQSAVVGVESPGGEIGVQYSYKQAALSNDTMIVFVRPFNPGVITTMDLAGTVVDAATGAPQVGVEVRLEDADMSVSTGPGGVFAFPDLEPGSYTVAVQTGSHCARVAQEYVALDAPASVELELAPVADEYGYTCLAGPRSFAPVSTQLSLSGDDVNAAISLPFPLDLYGDTHTSAWINSNGLVIFQPQPFGWWAPHELPSVHDAPSSTIAAMWSDWYVDGPARVWTGTNGTAPNRQFVIEWRNVRHVDNSSARVSFQVTIAETTGVIGVAWKDVGGLALEQGSKAVIGIQNTDGTIASVYSAFEQAVASGQGVVFTPGDPGLHTVSGTVSCAGDPVAGATVLLGDDSDTTDAQGRYEFTGVAAGPSGLIATAAGGSCAGSVAVPVTAVRGEPQTVDVDLLPVAEAPGYTATAGSTSMLATTTVVSLPGTDGGDDEYKAITPPFAVELYGQTYTQAWLDTNGVLMFVNRGFSDPIPYPIPADPWSPDAAVYPLWDDWVVDSLASVRTGVVGSAPNRQWVVEWRNVHPFNMWQRVDFQVAFSESTGQITFAYDDIDATFVEQGGAGLVGVENADSSVALQFSYLLPVLRSGRGLTFTPTS